MFPDAQPPRVMKISRTTTFRLTATLGLVFLCTLCVLLGLIYVLTRRELLNRTDEIIRHEAHVLAPLPVAQLPARIGAVLATNTSRLSYYALVDGQGRRLAGNFTPPAGLTPGLVAIVSEQGAMPPLRILVFRVGHGQDAGGALLVIGRDITQIVDLRRRATIMLATSGLAAALAVLITAVLLSIAPLRRIRRLTSLSARIAAGELAVRMPVSARGDELDVIAATINAMVEEIARLLEQVKNATDALAHDLRSPLAHARGRLELVRRQVAQGGAAPPGAGPGAAFTDVLDIVAGELDLVLTRFTALLRIAELEAANRRAGFALFDPMELASELYELYEPLAEEQGVSLRLSGSWGHAMRGDAKLLFEALSNCIENAIKFIAAGDAILVSVQDHAGMITLSIRDNGPGIPPEERASAVHRFQRGAATRHLPGSGLGLSLVAAIVHLHGFTLELADAAPGLDVRISGPSEGAMPAPDTSRNIPS